MSRPSRAAAGLLVLTVVLAAGRSGIAGEGPGFHTLARAGFGMVDEDGFVVLLAEQGLEWGGLELVLSGPFRLRVVDRDPSDGGVLREQDWDEPSDFARIVPRARFVRSFKDGSLRIEAGEQNGVGIGHGSVFDHFRNSTDMDRYQGGLLLDAGHRGNGLEFLIENVVDPEILGGRVRLAPIAWFTDAAAARRLEIGFTAAADLAVERNRPATGGPVVEERAIPVVGGDISVRAVDGERFLLEPYLDVNGMDGEAGLHAGLGASLRLAPSREIWLHLRGEYRYLGGDYHPALFNPFHEHDRRFFSEDPATGEPRTLADHLAETEDPVSHGGMGDITLDWDGILRVEARYDAEGTGRPHWILARIDVTPGAALTVGAFYAGRDPRQGIGIFSWDSLIGAGATGRVWGPLQVYTEFTRRYRLADGAMPLANETGFGAGLMLGY
jgi:hypothetical protein